MSVFEKDLGSVFAKLHCEDNKTTMSRMEKNSVDGIITSPPYNICSERSDNYYNIGYQDDLLPDEYIALRVSEFKKFAHILKQRGVICYNLSYHYINPSLPFQLAVEIERATDFFLADTICWKKKTSMPFQSNANRLSRICEFIFVFALDKNFIANKNIAKINERTGQTFYKKYNNFIKASNNDGIDAELKAAYSEELVQKLLRIYFPKRSVIYDPFSGIGTTAVACIQNGRSCIGSEVNENHYQVATDRVDSAVVNHDWWDYKN